MSSYENGNFVSSNVSEIANTYNLGNVKSTASKGRTGGITGYCQRYCYVKNCYISNTVTVKNGSTSATANIGSSSSYLGKIVGQADSNSTTYIDNVGTLTTMPTVYYVVNSLSDGESEYWSLSDVNAPKLLWEEE